jgi:acyl-coenzyme A thioesterase PaaI-like protein
MAHPTDGHDQRQHLVTWEDPGPGGKYLREKGGKAYLRALSRGEVAPPPAARLIGYVPEVAEEGRVVFRLDLAEHHLNPFGSLHGGIAATLLDAAMTGTVMSTLPVGTGCSTIELKVNYNRAIHRSVECVQ